MSNKPYSIVIVLIGLLFSLSANAFADIGQAKQSIFDLIIKGQYAQAMAQTEKLVTDFPADPCLQDALYLIARQYEWSDRYENAKEVYQQMLTNAPGDSWAGRANLGIAKTDVLFLIMSKSSQAGEAFNKLVADFKDNPDFPDALYYIGRRYEWADKYEDAKAVYRQLMRSVSTSDPNWADRSKLGFERANILSLIMSKDYDQAKDACNKLLGEGLSGHPDFPATLYWIAERYAWADKFEDARDFYQKIIQDYSTNAYAGRAKLGLSRVKVGSLIMSRNYSEAKKAFDELAAEGFSGHQDWPATLYWIAEKYKWADRGEDAKEFYQKVIQGYPNSPYAGKAMMCISIVNVQSNIRLYHSDEAKKSIDKLVADFNGNPDLPEALWQIAGKYRWSNRYEEERAIYQEILERYPDSEYTSKIKLGLARIGVHLLIKAEDFDNAQEAFAKLITEFNDHPDLEDTLYAIARHYGEAGRYEEERSAYQLIIQKYPDSQHKSKAEAGISSRSNALSLATSKDSNGSEEILDKIVADSNGNPNLARTLFLTGEECFGKGFSYRSEGRDAEAKEQILKAIAAWKRITEEVPPSAEYAPQAYHRMADCYFEDLGEYEKAIECCKKVVDNWPDYLFVADVQFAIGNYYERLAYSGIMPESAANPKMEEAYAVVIEKYPDSRNFKYALSKLAELNFNKGQWTKAAYYFEVLLQKYPENQRPSSIVYKLGRAYEEMGELDRATELYREFMKMAYPSDPLMEDVKTRLEKFDTPSAKNILTDIEMNGVHGGWYAFCVPAGEACEDAKWGWCDICPATYYTGCRQTQHACNNDNKSPTPCHTTPDLCGYKYETQCSLNKKGECTGTTDRVYCMEHMSACD